MNLKLRGGWLTLRYFALALVAIGLVIYIALLFINPSNDRNWNDDQEVLAYAEIDGDLVHIKNIRNFTYRSTTDYTPGYYDKTFDVRTMKNVYYIVEPFGGIPGSAHTFLSFEFEGDNFVAISVEIRKEEGETFSPLKGLFRRYELMYVVADERDVIKLRSNYRNDLVYVYPARTTHTKMGALFLDMIKKVNKLAEEPEFYNTITNTCTTNIADHINTISPERVPFSFRIILPGKSDELAYELGLIDTELSFEDARERFFINDRALKYADDQDFSVKIRGTQ